MVPTPMKGDASLNELPIEQVWQRSVVCGEVGGGILLEACRACLGRVQWVRIVDAE